MIELGSKYKIEVTQQLSPGVNINEYKLNYDKKNIKNNLFFFKKNFLCYNRKFDIAISRAGHHHLQN